MALHPVVKAPALGLWQRMRGREVFYPMGWDDNGLNVERRVQLTFGVTCDPSLPYDPTYQPPAKLPAGAATYTFAVSATNAAGTSQPSGTASALIAR